MSRNIKITDELDKELTEVMDRYGLKTKTGAIKLLVDIGHHLEDRTGVKVVYPVPSNGLVQSAVERSEKEILAEFNKRNKTSFKTFLPSMRNLV